MNRLAMSVRLIRGFPLNIFLKKFIWLIPSAVSPDLFITEA
jgi:hypothetical protein